jgi:membrane protease subunit (stomatin/prohibitin family)
MGLFNSKKEGGLMDVIRCDEQEYLVWKWRPSGEANSTKKENSIRYGSSLRVKEGEVAVFVYKKSDDEFQDFILGPLDKTIKSANFPILTNIVGTAFGGNSPFQAEIYFMNLSGINQIRFGIPYFDVYDPRFLDFGVPIAARGSITFNLTDYKSFIKLHRLINFDLENFKSQIKDAITKYIKGIITNAPSDNGIPVLQLERKVLELNDLIEPKIKGVLENDFGVNLKRFDLSVLEFDKESEEYEKLIKVTREQQEKTTVAQTDVGIKNLQDIQEINATNMSETLSINREEMQRAQKLTTESANMSAHQLNQQTDVAKTAAQSLGKMGQGGTGGAGGMDPGSMMASMAMGGAVGSGMAGMMGNMMTGMSDQQQQPPSAPQTSYMVSVNGQQAGPYNLNQLKEFVLRGEFNPQTNVWKQGMNDWKLAGEVQELNQVFSTKNNTPPPPPPK